jgi:NADH-quinone oxidoreductase subunit L
LEGNTTFDLLTGLVLLSPLASFMLCLLISERYSWLVTITAPVLLLVSTSLSVYLFLTIPTNTSYLIELDWFQVGQYTFNGSIELNRLSILMMPLITVISFLVHLYSIGYMAGDNGIRRYFAMLGFFTFSMLGIVLSDNLLMIFVFWELVGFSSYLLIGHWLEKPAASKAAQKAFIFNRIGDAGFLVGLMIVWANTQTFDLTELLHLPEIYSWQTAASLCLFCGVIGKSAQLPLFTWLPDAMEGPTPVSALIHAATMVAAGVFLLARVFPLFTPEALNVVAITGILTALLAALCALNQFDIKKILAYSTISQLGLMVTAVGVGSENAAMLHLLTHAFFKACLFLGAGSVIHALRQARSHACLPDRQAHENFDVRDIRNLGGLQKKLPVTFLLS